MDPVRLPRSRLVMHVADLDFERLNRVRGRVVWTRLAIGSPVVVMGPEWARILTDAYSTLRSDSND